MSLIEQDIFDARKKENEIFKELQSKSTEYYKSIRNKLYYLFMSFAFLTVLSIIPILFIYKPQNKGATYLVLILFLLTFIFLRISLLLEVKAARKKYSKFDDFLDNRRSVSSIIFPTNLEPLREAHLSEKLLPTIGSLSVIHKKRLINVYIKKSEKIKNSNWYIVTLLGVMLFAVWTGFISAAIGQEKTLNGMIGMFLAFLIISLFLTFCVCIYKRSLERIFLKNSFDYMLLTEIITTIDALSEAELHDTPVPPAC